MGKVWMDKIRRELFANAELQRRALKSITMSSRLPLTVRLAAQRKLAEMPYNTSASRIRMRCIETGRPRAVCRHTRLSRIAFREHVSDGMFPGVWKAR